MPQRRAAYPSALKTGAAHLALSTALFAGLTVAAAGVLNLIGDPDDAGPVVQVALFDLSGDEANPPLKSRLDDPTIPDFQLASMVAVRDRPALEEPSLGVEYAPAAAGRRTVAAAPQTAASGPRAPTVEEGSSLEPVGVRINGRTVLPGQAFSAVTAEPSLPSAPIAAVEERTAHGMVPAVSVNGTAPADAYARPFDNPLGKPTVSVILGGLGLNRTHTQTAIAELPPEITLSFSPHTKGLQTWIKRAREAGHEVLVEVPMEADSYGRVQPHPLTLKADASSSDTLSRLDRFLASASGYFGVINYEGERFARNTALARTVAEHLGSRGLALIEDGSLDATGFLAAADESGVRFARSSDVIDTRTEADAMRDRLMALENRANASGAGALATAMAYPITIDALRDWAEGLEARGLLLAPASHVVRSQSTQHAVPDTSRASTQVSFFGEAVSQDEWDVIEARPFGDGG